MDKATDGIHSLRKFRFIIFGVLTFIIVCTILFLSPGTSGVINLSATSSQPQEPNRRSAPVGNPAPAQMPANPSVNAVTQAAVKLGVLSCVSRINQVATFLTANNKSGVYIFPPKSEPDQHVFSASFEILRPDNSTLYATASFLPNLDAVYDTVEYVNVKCEELEKTVFKDLKRITVLKKNIVLLDGGNVKVFLMPAGSGTVVIKKEVVQ
jgi:hypothetical protein